LQLLASSLVSLVHLIPKCTYPSVRVQVYITGHHTYPTISFLGALIDLPIEYWKLLCFYIYIYSIYYIYIYLLKA
jgi:hypothetical protein